MTTLLWILALVMALATAYEYGKLKGYKEAQKYRK